MDKSNLWVCGGHISLKDGERIHIGGVLAPDILAMVGINFT